MNGVQANPFDRVRDLLVREFQIKPSKIKPDARIREDPGIWGDDGLELFITLDEQCDVDLSEYDHTRYFEPEGLNVRAMFTKEWWTTFKHPQTITVAQLAEAVSTGKWTNQDTHACPR